MGATALFFVFFPVFSAFCAVGASSFLGSIFSAYTRAREGVKTCKPA
jgi:hypothetical protein